MRFNEDYRSIARLTNVNSKMESAVKGGDLEDALKIGNDAYKSYYREYKKSNDIESKKLLRGILIHLLNKSLNIKGLDTLYHRDIPKGPRFQRE